MATPTTKPTTTSSQWLSHLENSVSPPSRASSTNTRVRNGLSTRTEWDRIAPWMYTCIQRLCMCCKSNIETYCLLILYDGIFVCKCTWRHFEQSGTVSHSGRVGTTAARVLCYRSAEGIHGLLVSYHEAFLIWYTNKRTQSALWIHVNSVKQHRSVGHQYA